MAGTLRQRFLHPLSSTPDSSASSREPSPAKDEPSTLVSNARLEQLKRERAPKPAKRYQIFLLGLGGLLGILGAGFVAQKQDVINLEGLVDWKMESLIDVIPAGIVKDARDLTVCFCLFPSCSQLSNLETGMLRADCQLVRLLRCLET